MIIGGGIRTGGVRSGGAVGLNTFGGSVSAFGFYQNFAANRFVARVPGTQTRTFQETHVYTGGPKLSLKGDGNLGWNNHNILQQTNLPTASTWVLSNCTATHDGTLDPFGDPAVKITVSSTTTTVFSMAPTNAGNPGGHTVTTYFKQGSAATDLNYFWLRDNTAGINVYIARVNLSDGTLSSVTNAYSSTCTVTALTNGWFRVVLVTPYVSAPAATMRLYLGPDSGTETANKYVYIARPKLTKGQVDLGDLPNPTSVTRLDEPTIFNTSGTRLGIVLEPAATNLALASQDFGNATYWTTSTAAVVANTETAPDGTLTADKLNETAGVFTHYVVQSPTLTAAVHTSSCYVKAAERTWCWLRTTGGVATYFNLSGAGAVGTLGHTSATIEALPNGWYRCAIVWTATVGGSIGIGPATADNTNNYDGVASNGIYVWGSQTETGTVATSYIPTTTASVTRTADTCYRVLGPEWSASAFTLYAEATLPTTIVGGAYTLVGLSDGTTANRCGIAREVSGTRMEGFSVASSVLVADLYIASSLGATVKAALSVTTNDVAFCVDGGAVSTDVSAALPTGMTRLELSAIPNCAVLMQTARVKMFSTALSDADIQSLTTTGANPTTPTIDFNYATGVYQYTPVNAGVTTSYSLSTLISSGLMTLTGSPSAKWVRGSNGLLTEVAAGSLAIEYDASGNVLGCINTEPARTNSETRSSTSSWPTFQATSVNLSSEVDPTGGTGDVRKLAATATSGVHSNYNGVTATAAPWTSSIFAKAAELSWIKVRCDNGTSTGAWFNLSTGAIGTVESGVTATIERFANGWYRCSATRTLTATTGYNSIELAIADGSNSYDGAANPGGVLIWGAQFEAGSYASSHIPTAGSTVTRNADVWTLNLGSWFDNSRWIVASKVYAPRANMNDGSNATVLWTLEPASGSADYTLHYVSSTNRIDWSERAYSVNGAAGNNTGLAYPATIRSAFGFSPSNTKASLNGATQSLTGTPSPIQPPLTRVGIGNFLVGTNPDQGSVYIQSLNIFPVVPTQDNVNQYAGAA